MDKGMCKKMGSGGKSKSPCAEENLWYVQYFSFVLQFIAWYFLATLGGVS
jgi:hypothetical protein